MLGSMLGKWEKKRNVEEMGGVGWESGWGINRGWRGEKGGRRRGRGRRKIRLGRKGIKIEMGG